MNILVFGKSGQVAQELARLAPDAVFLGRDRVDLSNPSRVEMAIAEHAPSAVINAAAYTAVDRAEDEESQALAINGSTPARMAQVCAARSIPFVHISTDYVFDGEGDTPFKPDAETGPLGAYGRTKLAGEQGVMAAGGANAILRTSWVFSAHGGNFVKTMLRLAQTRNQLSVVEDQIGGPTPASDIAAACLQMATQLKIDPNKAGIYHFAGAPDTTWADFARATFAEAGLEVTVNGIPSADYPTLAARPLNSRLDCASLQMVFGIERPVWADGLKGVLRYLQV